MNYSIEQKVFTYGSRITDQSYYTNTINIRIGGIGEEALRREINNTKTFLKMIPFLSSSSLGLGLIKMVGTINIHLVRILDTRITIEDC